MEELYNNLFEAGDYTGSFEDFKEQFGNEEKSKVLYKALSDNGEYTKSIDEFNTQFGFSSAEDFPTDDVPSAVAESQEGEIALKDTELAPVDTSLESQSMDPFVINGEPVSEKEFKEYQKDLAERDVLEEDESFFSATGFVDFFSDIATAAKEGWRQGELVDPSYELYKLGDKATDEDVLNFVNKNKEIARKNLGSAEMQDFNRIYEEEGGGFWGFIKGVVNNPSTLPTMLVSSISNQISSLRSDEVRAAGAAAAATGAVAGSAIPLPGVSTLGGAVAGGMAGTMGAMETGLTFAELLQEEAGSLDPDKIKKILQDPEKLADLKNRALNRGVAIAAVEMATLGIAKGVGGKLATAGFKRAPMVAAGVTGGVEIAGGGLGEVAGRYVADQEMDVAEIGFEAFAGLGSAPLTLGKQALNIQTNLDRIKVNKEINRTEYGNIVDVFKPETKTDDAEIKISKIKNSRKILDEKVDAQVKRAEITKEEGDAIKKNFIKTQGTVNKVKSLNLSEKAEIKIVELQKEKSDLEAQIKEINDKALTGTQSERLDAINKEQDLEIKKDRKEKTLSFAKDAASIGIKSTALSPEDFNKKARELEINNIDKKLDKSKIAEKTNKINNTNYSDNSGGFFANGEFFMNKDRLVELNQLNVGAHETLHPILNAIVGDADQQGVVVEKFKNQLSKDQLDFMERMMEARYTDKETGIVNKDTYNKEYLTVFSDAIADKEIKYNETLFTKIGDMLMPLFRSLGFSKLKFDTGKDVYNFMREYSKSAEKGAISKDIKQFVAPKLGVTTDFSKTKQSDFSNVNQEKIQSLEQELETLDENEFEYDPDEFDSLRSNLQYKITQAKKAPVKKPVVKKEKAEKEETTKKTYDNEALVETIKSKETTRKDKAAAESELVESFDTMALKAIKYDTRKGDLDRTEVRDYLRQFLPKIIESYKPDESKFSTWVYNNIAPKAQQTYEKFRKIADKSLDVKAGGVGSVAEVASTTDTKPVETTKKPSRKIKPIELIRDLGLQKKYRDAVKSMVESGKATIDGSTFGNLKDLAAEVTAEIFDIPVLKVTDPADNLAFKDIVVDNKNIESIKKYYPEAKVGMIIKSESSKIQDIIKSMGPDLFKLMPPNNVAPELATVDAQAYKSVKGTGLKIPTSLMKAFYEATGKRSKGVTSQVVIKELKKDLTYEQFLEDLGIKKGEANKYDRKIGQRLKAITMLFGKLATNTEIRQLDNVTDVQKQNIQAGKSDIQFSKISNAYKATTNKEANIDFNDEQKVSKFKKDIFDVFDSFSEDDFVKYILPTASKGYNYKWKTINGKSVYSEDFKNVRNIAFEGRSDFFNSYNEHREKKGLKPITHEKGDRLVEYTDIDGNSKKIKLSVLKKQSSEGVNSGKFFETIKERINIAKDQRKGLKKILKTLIKYNKKNPNDKTFIPMIFTMMNSNTDSLIRTAAIPKWIMYVNGLSDSDYVYEHSQTASDTSVELMKALYNSKTEAEFNSMFDKIMKNFDVAIIPKDQDSIVNKTNKMNGPRKGDSKSDYSLDLIYPDEEGFPTRYKYANENNGANISLTPILDFSESKNVKSIKELYKSTLQASKSNNDMLPKSKRLKGDFTMDQVLDEMRNLDDKQTEAGIQFSNTQNLDKDFNDILEKKSGIASDKEYQRVKAETVGASKGRFNFFIPPSAEDFVGLLYATLGKGKTGDAQMAWYKKTLLNPFARAMENISRDRNALGRDFRELKKKLKIVPRDLKKKIPGDSFTKEQAVRVWIWNQIGKDVPGLDKSDIDSLVKYVDSNPDLKVFGTEIMKLNKGTGYISPTDSWNTGTITTDLLETLNTNKRKKYLELWQQNVDIIFSEKNLNKLEAIYGKQYRMAMENILKRMKTGRNRSTGADSLTTRVTDWLTGSIGAIMFFNTRSAVLQTLSAVNFINFGDNNILAAGKAFANQKQYWTDFKKLFNSEFLIERRDGLKMNVNEADIADIAKERGVRGVINKLLKLGFTPTQIADSFAIASGGATFYRNRVKSLMKQGKSSMAAEREALRDFREIAEESQQSSRPDRISQQQAGPLGRVILAFANTPAQYARLIKKAASDLKNGRGDAKTNISKIIYYGVAQNLIFNALQQALFAITFGEDEEEDEKKVVGVANGMLDSILRGAGIGGAVFTVIKNAGIKLAKESAKDNPKYENAASELLKLSPPISSKISKLKAAGRSFSWDEKEIKEKGFSLDNPAYLAGANVISATTNVPLDRVVKKINNVTASTQENISVAQRIALLAGWSEWQLGIKKSKKSKSRKNVRGKNSKKRVLN